MTQKEFTKRRIQRKAKRIAKEFFSLVIIILFVYSIAVFIDINNNNNLPGQELSSWNVVRYSSSYINR